MKLVSGPFSEPVAHWVGAQLGCADWGPCTAIGVADSADNLIGGVVFNNYRADVGNIEVSFASIRADWLTPRLVRAILHYPFTQLGVRRITTLTPKKNRRARQFLKKFGFVEEGNIREGFGTDDMIVSGLLAKEWAKNRFHGKTETAYSA